MAKAKLVYRYRSAVTGRWVRECYALRYPHLTVRVAIKPRCAPQVGR